MVSPNDAAHVVLQAAHLQFALLIQQLATAQVEHAVAELGLEAQDFALASRYSLGDAPAHLEAVDDAGARETGPAGAHQRTVTQGNGDEVLRGIIGHARPW